MNLMPFIEEINKKYKKPIPNIKESDLLIRDCIDVGYGVIRTKNDIIEPIQVEIMKYQELIKSKYDIIYESYEAIYSYRGNGVVILTCLIVKKKEIKMTEIQELLQGYNNLADELKERTKNLEELEQEMENTEKPNLQQISECYNNQCDLVLQKFAERLKEEIRSVKGVINIYEIIDNTLKEFIK